MAQVKAVFYIPLRDTDGRDLAGELKDLEMELYLHFVGWTSLGYIRGAYQMADGTQSLDESEAFALILEEARLPELEQILLDFKGKTKQEAIYLEVQRHIEVRFLK
ncbi:MAG: hypothetical protein HYS12_26560 [Planctomycetes bacterium]|nr:hypothetical protein [Planctomycetota bacterium]